jgi:hypothetical protein
VSELPNIELLIRLAKMTGSSNDNEALVACRKLNEQLKKFGGDWESLLRGKMKITIIEDPFAKASTPPPKNGSYSRPQPPHRPPPPPPPPPPQPQPRWKPQPTPKPTGKPIFAAGKKRNRPRVTIDDLI